MSTRSRIIAKTTDGTIKSIYCHFDGYPEGVGAMLKEHYTDQGKIDTLMLLGDISFLRENLEKPEGHSFETPVEGYTVAYGRDRGEKNTQAKVHISIENVIALMSGGWEEYAHIWDGSNWRTVEV